MEWIRGVEIGRGGFGSINIAVPNREIPGLPPVFAVKSCEASQSASLRNELDVLLRLGECRQVIRCFGAANTHEGPSELYNLMLEYAPGGCLANEMRRRGGKLPEQEVRRHARSVLEAMRHIHSKGFVHGDIKVQNILVFPPAEGSEFPEVKVADFGLSREAGCTTSNHANNDESEEKPMDRGYQWRGTPLYMSPEAVNDNEYEAPSDVWALGCAIVEMATGRAPWHHSEGANVYKLMIRIGVGDETPIIPHDLSEDGKDFLTKCFVKDPTKRWTTEMLLSHPFIAGTKETKFDSMPHSPSPRTHFDIMNWDSSSVSSSSSSPFTFAATREFWLNSNEFGSYGDHSSRGYKSPVDRIHNLVAGTMDYWERTDSQWITVR